MEFPRRSPASRTASERSIFTDSFSGSISMWRAMVAKQFITENCDEIAGAERDSLMCEQDLEPLVRPARSRAT